MSNSWLIFAIAGTAIWAVVNIIDDNLNIKVYPYASFGVIVSGFFSVLIFTGLLYLPFYWPAYNVILLSILSGALSTVGLWFYFRALKTDYPSVVVALMNLSPIIVVTTSFIFFHEVLSVYQYTGLAIILASSTLITFKPRKLKFSGAYFYMIIAALFFGSGAVLEKEIYKQADFFSAFVLISIGAIIVAVIFFVFLSVRKKQLFVLLSKIKSNFFIFFISELLNLIGIILISYSINLGSVSIVKSIESTQALFVLLLSTVIFPFKPNLVREALAGGKVRKILCITFGSLGLYLLQY